MIVTGPVLALALLVVSPLGLRLLVPHLGPRAAALPRLALAPGALATAALALPVGVGAAALTVPWLALAAVVALAALVALRRAPSLEALGRLGATGGLVMGAGWLLLDRLGATGAFGTAITRLTAVHFHYAGFAAALLATLAWRASRAAVPRLAAVALLAVLGGPWLTALGFTVDPVFQTIGALIVALGLLAVGALTLRYAVPATRAGGRRRQANLLTASALAVFAPMVLAAQWGLSVQFGTPALSLDAMALTHGLLNALGFALLGLLGWTGVPDIAPQR